MPKTYTTKYVEELKRKVDHWYKQAELENNRKVEIAIERDAAIASNQRLGEQIKTLQGHLEICNRERDNLNNEIKTLERKLGAEIDEHLIYYSKNQATQEALRIAIQELKK